MRLIGCHRSYYRRQADAEAYRLIREKSLDPRWDTASGNIKIDPQSRMFDPFSQDHPPIPPDDPSSHQLMHCVDGKEGFPQWHANGDTNYVENPLWKSYLPINEQGQCVLNLDRAFQLALINSPDFQRQRETLYLSALDVSLQRFGFDSQLFAGTNTFAGLEQGNTFLRNTLGVNGGGINLERLGTTGTNFVVGLANTILFNFGGNDTQTATTLLDFSIIQPLLRGAGRDRIMESLTQSERDLLANIRQLERFRRGFYLSIAIGRNAGATVNSNLLASPGIAQTQAGGYLGLLERQQRIRNQELNVRQLEAVLEQFKEFFKRERLDAVQLKRFETSVYNQQRSLLTTKTAYQNELDSFKIELGLPPDLDIVIEDDFLNQFELISEQVNEQLIEIKDLREETGAALNRIDDLFAKRDKPGFEWPPNLAELVDELLPYVERTEQALDQIVNEDRAQLESDFQRLDASRAARLEYLKKLKDSIQSGQILSDIDISLFEPASIPQSSELRALLDNPRTDEAEFVTNEDGEQIIPQRSIVKRASNLKQEFEDTKAEIGNFREKIKGATQDQIFDLIIAQFQEKIPGQLSELNNLVLELSLLQATARSNSIEITDVNIRAEQAIRIAKCFRRDWMNARAALVDNWRNIEFVADQLESQLDLVLDGEMSTLPDASNPFKIRFEPGRIRAGLRFDLPIVRLQERNNYRAALINYQQTRRSYYQFEDSVKRNIRQIVRIVDQNKVLFELDRRTVQVSIENIEVNRFELDRPVPPGASLRLGATTAQNLSDAIIQLNGNQNAFLSSWVQLEVLRRSLDFDMGTMQLNEMGEWVDPGEIGPAIGIRAAEIMGVDLNLECQFCENIGVAYDDIPSVDQDPVFDRTPTNADTPGNTPEQPPLEPLPQIEPATKPLSVPEKPKPALDGPKSSMRNSQPESPAKTLSQIPLLFEPVLNKSDAQPKTTASTPAQPAKELSDDRNSGENSAGNSVSETTTAEDKVAAQQAPDSQIPQESGLVDPSFARSVSFEESVLELKNSKLPLIEQFSDATVPGDLISSQFVAERPVRASAEFSAQKRNAAPAVTGPAKVASEPKTEPNSQASGNRLKPLPGTPLNYKTDTEAKVFIEKHSSHQDSKQLQTADSSNSVNTDESSTLDWQSSPSSLGGILHRFQTNSSPDNPAGSSKN